MRTYPTDIRLSAPDAFEIDWSDGVQQRLRAGQLRTHCPCAACREKLRDGPQEEDLLPVLGPEEAQPLGFVSVRPVGNYAYAIAFSDGHDTGIFPLELLRQLGDDEP